MFMPHTWVCFAYEYSTVCICMCLGPFPSVSWCICVDSTLTETVWWILPHGDTMQNCVLITAHKKCGAESPLTQAKQTVERHVNNSSLAATIIHLHLSSVSQCQTTRPLHPDPFILHSPAPSDLMARAQSLSQHVCNWMQGDTMDPLPVHHNNNADWQSLVCIHDNLVFTEFLSHVKNLKSSHRKTTNKAM